MIAIIMNNKSIYMCVWYCPTYIIYMILLAIVMFFSNIFCRTISSIKGWDVHPVARTGSRYSIGKEGLVEWFGEFKAATLCVLWDVLHSLFLIYVQMDIYFI